MKEYEMVHPAPLTTEDLPTRLVAESPAFLAARAHYTPDLVRVNPSRLEILARFLASPPATRGIDTCEEWGSEERAFVPYFLMLNAINYKFWHRDAAGIVHRYRAWGATGSVAMSRGMRMLFHSTERIWRDPNVSEDEASSLIESKFDECFPEIPDRSKRISMLLEVAGCPRRLRNASKAISRRIHDYSRLTPLDILNLVESFPLTYGQDEFCKRPQLALMMIATRYSRYGHKIGLAGFSAAADYQLPKVLRAEGVLVYSPTLVSMVDRGILLPSGSPEESAIRSATILACADLSNLSSLDMLTVDHWLWTRRECYPGTHFHLTDTADY